ncbi:MAG: hypothetical protein ACI8PT_004489, partial [Gammaproteobacteria bacterium]
QPNRASYFAADPKGLPRNTPSKTEGVDGCCQQGARSENTPVFDRRATPLAVPSSSRIGRVISPQILSSMGGVSAAPMVAKDYAAYMCREAQG